ncbi:MAG: Crp/Fnr family transcriptional regulator [Chloroflexota bacterium]
MSERTYTRGHHLHRAGDSLSYVFVIRSGLAVLTEFDRLGNPRTPLTYHPDDVLGLVSVTLGSGWARTCTALTDTEVFLVPPATFIDLYYRSPELAWQVSCELSRMVRRSEQTTIRFALAPVASRLAAFLLQCVPDGTDPRDGSPSVRLPFPHRDISVMLGTSRESISRLLARFCRSGLIRMDGKQVTILEPDALLHLAES